MAKYYKKVTVEKDWTQPVLTSNGTLGGNSFAVWANSVQPGFDTAKGAFSGSAGWGTGAWVGANYTNADYIFYNPIPLKITSLGIYGNSNGSGLGTCNLLCSNDGTNYITVVSNFNGGGRNGSFTLTTELPANPYKYWRIKGAYAGDRPMIGEFTIIASEVTQAWQPCTKEEYDNLPADQRKIVTDIYNGFVRKKYLNKKIIVKAWTQPVLTSNGTLGGNAFACFAKSEQYPAWEAFTTIDDTHDTWLPNNYEIPTWIGFYNPTPIKVSSLTITNWSAQNRPITGGIVQGSNDYSNWEDIKSFTNSVTGQGSNWTINVNSTNAYNYYRLYITSASGSLASVQYMQIVATYQETKLQECTEAEYNNLPYDQRKIVDVFYSTKKISGYRDYSVNFTDSNILTVGALTIDNNGIASGFSNANYCQLPKAFAPANSDTWEWQIAIKLSSAQTGGALCGMYAYRDWIHGGGLDGYVYYTGSNGLYIDVSKSSVGAYIRTPTSEGQGQYVNATYIAYCNANITIENDRLYKIRVSHSGLDNTYTLYIIEEDDTVHTYPFTNGARYGIAMPSAQTQFGMWVEGNYEQADKPHTFNGNIDLLNSYIKVNNQLWWSNKQEIKSGSIITNYLVGSNSEMKEVVVERAWEQPVLTSNGTLGGDSFAVYSTSTKANIQNLYKAFNSTDNPAGVVYATIDKNDVIFYNPNPLKCNQFSIMDYWSGWYYQYGLRAGIVKGSNNGTDWVTIANISGGTAQKKNVFNFTNNNFYKYYKLTPTDVAPEGWCCQSFRITNNPTQQISQWQH